MSEIERSGCCVKMASHTWAWYVGYFHITACGKPSSRVRISMAYRDRDDTPDDALPGGVLGSIPRLVHTNYA